MVGVEILLGKFGFVSGVMIEVKRIFVSRDIKSLFEDIMEMKRSKNIM